MTSEYPDAIDHSVWQQLRNLTSARIGLGRAGTSLPTAAHLDFQTAHARARDAVHLPFDRTALSGQLAMRRRASLFLHSAASDRQCYLQRPDLGRKLDAASMATLCEYSATHSSAVDLAVVVADGLSALAAQRHALPLLKQIDIQAAAEGWSLSPVLLVEQGRVALGDEIGQLLGARMLVMLIGERPGLSSPDSLGIYFTYDPKPGLTDANRNCISNIRPEGLSYDLAVHRLLHLLREARRRQVSGVSLKDESHLAKLEHIMVKTDKPPAQ